MDNKFDVNSWYVENESDLDKKVIKVEGAMINYCGKSYVFDLNDMYLLKQYKNEKVDKIYLSKNVCDELAKTLSNHSLSEKTVEEHTDNFSGFYLFYYDVSENYSNKDSYVMIYETNDDVPKEFLEMFNALKKTYEKNAENSENFKNSSETQRISLDEIFRKPFGFINKEITKENVNEYVKKINPKLLKKKTVYLILSIMFLIIGWVITMFTYIPFVMIIGIALFIIYLNINGRVKNIKNSIIALKTSNKFLHYCSELISVTPNQFGIKCGTNTIYNKDNAILSAENICLVYISQVKFLFIPITSQVMFGTINGDLIPFGYKNSKQKEEFILNFMAKNNPNIMIGASSENLKRFKQIKKNR